MTARETWQKLLCDGPAEDPLQAALALKRERGDPGGGHVHRVRQAEGLRVCDIVCTCGPGDRAFEEQHPYVAIAVVLSGSFTHRGDPGRALMTPGSILLENPDRWFTCAHEHAQGDRCVSFQFEPDTFERICADAGARRTELRAHRIPAMRATAPLVARAMTALDDDLALQELALGLAGVALRTTGDVRPIRVRPRDEQRVAEVVRLIEASYDQPHTLFTLARSAGMSSYHFLRVFKRVAGATPHQLLLRMRLNAAARLLKDSADPVTGIAQCVGFEDLSNFIRSFRSEFGVPPARYRSVYARRAPEGA